MRGEVSAIAALVLCLGASPEAVSEPPVLVTEETALPVGAEDRRDDGVLRDESGRPVTHRLLGKILPTFEAPKVGGGTIRSLDLEGRWTVMVVWGVWCHDSRNDMDNIAAIATHYESDDAVDFISVHVPQNKETLDKMYRNYRSVAGFFDDRGVSFATALDETADLRASLQIDWTPTYLLIGPDLTVKGFRTDLSKGGETAVADFIGAVDARVAHVETPG
ncbi:MAG: TlpA disulfide reductase family protein [Pseudomonadota bacterium]